MKTDPIRRLLSLFFPDRCPYCRTVIRHPLTECEDCAVHLYSGIHYVSLRCGNICAAPFLYQSAYRKAVLDLKFKGRIFNAESLGKAVAASTVSIFPDDRTQVVTCIPMSRDRLRRRGYNQSELIAKRAAAELGLPYERLLYRENGAKIQHDLSFEERLANTDLRFGVIDPGRIQGRRILLIDDIVTSGMTMSECCRLLSEAGAEKVICACAATAGGHNEILFNERSE